MPKGGKWEEELGAEYRAEYKKAKYDTLMLQFRKDAPDGLTREAVQRAAAGKGMKTAEYIKALIREDMGLKNEEP